MRLKKGLSVLGTAALVATLTALAPIAAGSSSGAGPTAPPWEPDANAASPYAGVIFYDAKGRQVTSGTGDLTNAFAWAVGTTAVDDGTTKASLAFADPKFGTPPGAWNSTAESGTTTWAALTAANTPASVLADVGTYPVAQPGPTGADISSWMAGNPSDPTVGYASTIEVRLTDTGPGGVGNPAGTYWDTDIAYNTTASSITVDGTTVPANGWAQLFPFVTRTTTALTSTLTSPQVSGTHIPLKAAVSPAHVGKVQFYDGAIALGSPVTVSAGVANFTDSRPPGAGTHSYTAVFVPGPPPGDETGINTSTARVIGGSTSNALSMRIAQVIVKSAGPKVLSRPITSKTVTINGAGFASGATVSASGTGVTFASVVVTSSTKLTVKATVTSTAALGARTITVTVGTHSGTCTCLTIVAAPTLKSISPSSVAPGSSHATTITGTGFVTGATVTGPSGVTFSAVTVVSSTKITATMTVSSTAPAGSKLTVTVTNNSTGGYGKATGQVLTIT